MTVLTISLFSMQLCVAGAMSAFHYLSGLSRFQSHVIAHQFKECLLGIACGRLPTYCRQAYPNTGVADDITAARGSPLVAVGGVCTGLCIAASVHTASVGLDVYRSLACFNEASQSASW